MFIGDLRNAEHLYKLSIKAKADHLPVIINYSQFFIQQVRCSYDGYFVELKLFSVLYFYKYFNRNHGYQ